MQARLLRLVVGAALLSSVDAGSSATRVRQQEVPPPAAKPIEPVPAIVNALRSHTLVAIASHHGNEQINAFDLSLIRDPAFRAIVSDIVVEFGNARYQSVIDRFVSGADVPPASLRKVWGLAPSAADQFKQSCSAPK